MSTATLHRVILSYPTVVALSDTTGAAAPRSWIQLARTGSFKSKRYGNFSIEKSDLRSMLTNFNTVTPKAPTLLPVDWDHLSMQEPKLPGDGAAAGWMKRLELRDGGDTLWAEVEWTPKAAEAIKNREYQFVSPSFVKDHTHKDGKKIGTTLLAAAITNHPFLEGMQALTLSTPAIAGVHLSVALRDLVAAEDGAVHLAELGQRVSFKDDGEQTPELTDDERRRTFIVKSIIGEGDDQFVRLAANANPIPPDQQQQEDATMHAKNADDELIRLASTIEREQGISRREATIEAGRRRSDLVDARHAEIRGEPTDDAETQARPLINLRAGESFIALCQRTADERQINLAAAIKLVGQAHPTLAEAYGRGEM